VLAIGEELTVFDGGTGAIAFAVAVEGVSPDVACADPASPPAENGHLIAVQVRVTTGADLAAIGGPPVVRAADFRFLGPDGVPLAAAGTPGAVACLPDAVPLPPGPVTAGQELTATVVLDVPATTGTVVFAPDFLAAGAEWAY
jgi:hypothetical protein